LIDVRDGRLDVVGEPEARHLRAEIHLDPSLEEVWEQPGLIPGVELAGAARKADLDPARGDAARTEGDCGGALVF